MIGFSVLGALLIMQASQPAPVITISAAELARAPRLTSAPQPDWRIGGEDTGPYSFGRIVGATFKRDGGVAVLEFNPPEVRLYNSAGKHQSSFGRRGRGPGEFENVQRLMSSPGDSLAVSQMFRVSVFDGTGKHARTVSTATANTLALAYRILGDGSMLASVQPIPTPEERASKREGITRDSTRIVVLAANGAEIARDLGKRPGTEMVMARHGVASTITTRAYGAALLLEGGDSFAFIMQTEVPQFDVLRANSGAQVRRIALALTPRQVRERDREEFARSRRVGAARGKNPALAVPGVEAYLKLMNYPENFPYFDAMRWSYDQVVRLRRYVAPFDAAVQWLSLTLAGELLSVIELPAKVRVLDFDRDHVLLVERDSDDLEYLALYKLVPAKR